MFSFIVITDKGGPTEAKHICQMEFQIVPGNEM
jgi:hypothetical protein